MTEKKRAGVSFENDLNIKFEYDKDNGSAIIYKNGVPIAEGEGVSPEELAEILTAYTTLTKLNTELAKYLTKKEANALATKAELASYATKAELEDYATKTDLDDYAEKTDVPVIETGTTAGRNITAGSYVDFEITFTKTFATAPQVVATLSSTSEAAGIGNLEVAVNTTSTTGATIRVFNNDTVQRTPAVRWVAVL